jgi:hypothetical protein
MWGGALISTLLGTELPGPGTIWVTQSLNFRRPVGLGDVLTVSVTVTQKKDGNRVVLDCKAINQAGEAVIDGVAEVVAPVEKILRPRIDMPEVALLDRGRHYRRLIEMPRGLAPIRTAVVHPVDALSLVGAIEAAREKLIVPVLVGPAARIRAAGEAANLDLSSYEIVSTEHSDAAAVEAVAMARANIWLVPKSLASCSARAFRSFLPAVPTRYWYGSDLPPSRFYSREEAVRHNGLPLRCSVLNRGQCDISVGTVMDRSMPRVTPPRMRSFRREWP